MSTDDPEWDALHRKMASWDERVRARAVEIQKLDERLRELEQRMQALRVRLAKGTGVMGAVAPDPEPAPVSASEPAPALAPTAARTAARR